MGTQKEPVSRMVRESVFNSEAAVRLIPHSFKNGFNVLETFIDESNYKYFLNSSFS